MDLMDCFDLSAVKSFFASSRNVLLRSFEDEFEGIDMEGLGDSRVEPTDLE